MTTDASTIVILDDVVPAIVVRRKRLAEALPWLREADRDGRLCAALSPSLSLPNRMVAMVEGWILGLGQAFDLDGLCPSVCMLQAGQFNPSSSHALAL